MYDGGDAAAGAAVRELAPAIARADCSSILIAARGMRGAGLLANDARELTYDLQRGRYRSCEYTGTAGLNRMPKEA